MKRSTVYWIVLGVAVVTLAVIVIGAVAKKPKAFVSSYENISGTEMTTTVTPSYYVDMSARTDFDQRQKCFVDVDEKYCMYIPEELNVSNLEIGKHYKCKVYIDSTTGVYCIVEIYDITE